MGHRVTMLRHSIEEHMRLAKIKAFYSCTKIQAKMKATLDQSSITEDIVYFNQITKLGSSVKSCSVIYPLYSVNIQA